MTSEKNLVNLCLGTYIYFYLKQFQIALKEMVNAL